MQRKFKVGQVWVGNSSPNQDFEEGEWLREIICISGNILRYYRYRKDGTNRSMEHTNLSQREYIPIFFRELYPPIFHNFTGISI